MPKTSGGNISIHVAEATDNLLVIKITDDGIGRVAAAAIKSKKETYHKSLGTKVTGERIALINEKFKSNATVVINDLYNNNEAAGTQVIIKLPLE
jgi:Ni,Fe-hydrogenase maturation factor